MNLSEKKRAIKEEVEKRKKEFPLEWLGRSLAYNNYPPRDILPHLKRRPDKSYALLCALKTKEHDINALKIAQSYERDGVDAICVEVSSIVELEFITAIRRYVATPILQRGYIVDEYQLVESVVYGADCIELIPQIFSAKELKKMVEYARHLGLEALITLNDKEDLTKAIFAGASLLGVNTSNYSTLVPLTPNGKVIVCEGEFKSEEVIKNIALEGVDAFMFKNCPQDLLQKV